MPGDLCVLQVFEMDVSKQLQAYEVEYHVLQEELMDSSPLSDNQRMDKLEKANSSLRKQNLDLLEQLQVHTCTHIHTGVWPLLGGSAEALAPSFPSLLAFVCLPGPVQ